MIYRMDSLTENRVNPITGDAYDPSWAVFILVDSTDYKMMCGSFNGCAYTLKCSRHLHENWKMAVGDFAGYNEANGKNSILVMSEADFAAAKTYYHGHTYHEALLREEEPAVLVHSTPLASWEFIQRDGMLKSWNYLNAQGRTNEAQPIGMKLGDPVDFRDYIMFGGGTTGEIVVNSRQHGKIVMDEDAEYVSGARLYFDAKKMADDGLLIRDGCHLKVKDKLALEPYLIWTATWKTIGLTSPISTPKIFAEVSDKQFRKRYQQSTKG